MYKDMSYLNSDPQKINEYMKCFDEEYSSDYFSDSNKKISNIIKWLEIQKLAWGIIGCISLPEMIMLC